MSERWMGLHATERHYTGFVYDVLCNECGQRCAPKRICRCCLVAEVEALRQERDALREALDDTERVVGVLESQVERVRRVPRQPEVTGPPVRLYFDRGWNACLREVSEALDGAE